ncbi:hypothetical protein [Nostoc sp. WHI]|uniref:hypothetical protein n=1 Tax=Nostoc sp. WHI TaxID=2650611 RepID=UPI0018C5943D|nr:hypothetical protein [Nostoc sp. WHI]MBG1271446.1 hypothetical protein [Nostoc sp. WHI]
MQLQQLQLFHIVLGSVSCSDPNPLQWTVIVTLVVGSGVFVVGSGVSIVSIVTKIVTMISAGASFEAISAALGGHIAVASGSLEMVFQLVAAISGILSC